MTRPFLYRGTRLDESLRLNGHGILWLTDNPEAAKRYVRFGDRGLLWRIRLKEDAKILDLTDLSIPLTLKIFDAYAQYLHDRGSGLLMEDWEESANFALLEHHPWVRAMILRHKRQGAVVADTISTMRIPHLSVALFSLKAIESAEAETIPYDRRETIGNIEAAVEDWRRANPLSMKPFRGRAGTSPLRGRARSSAKR